MTAPRRAVVGLLAVALVASTVAGAAGVGGAAPAAERAQPGQGVTAQEGGLAAQAVDADDVTLRVDLQADGDAVWTVTYRQRLETANETDAFRTLRDDVESNPDNYTERFERRLRTTVRAAENATGREMALRNVTVTAEIQRLTATDYGIVRYRFEWTNFAVVEGDTLRAGDAIAGLYLDGRTSLVIGWPEGYGVQTVDPDPEPGVGGEDAVGWSGDRQFGPERPRIVVAPAAGGDGGDGPGGGAGFPTVPLVGAVVVLVLAAAVGLSWSRRRGGLPLEDAGGGDGGPGASGGDTADGEASAAGPAVGGAAGAAGGGADDADEPPEELLSNEERVMKLVRERGGRIKQQEIVEAFDWTEAKTSQVVRDLRDEGELEGFRLGRENVLRLPEEDEGEV